LVASCKLPQPRHKLVAAKINATLATTMHSKINRKKLTTVAFWH
jgi:hypothetical protein